MPLRILRVAVPSPLRRCFDYIAPNASHEQAEVIACRVLVPFGRKRHVAFVLAQVDASQIDEAKLKEVEAIIDEAPLIPHVMVRLLQWASEYYQYPIGEVIFGALPGLLRQGKVAQAKTESCWRLSKAGASVDIDSLLRAPRQQALLKLLATAGDGLSAAQITETQVHWRSPMRVLVEKGWVEVVERAEVLLAAEDVCVDKPKLNAAQQNAVSTIVEGLGGFDVFLLHGITGSGKTEVYLTIIEQALGLQQQALVLVPEIGLTPQLVQRFQARFAVPVVVLHSGLSDQQRLNAWLWARDGQAAIVIGTRSAVFTPLARPGVIILDEEHDVSFKQQDGFRYSARDVAIKRGQLENVPVVLGSATPSLETLENCNKGRYIKLELPQRAGVATAPEIAVLDVRKQPMLEGLSSALLNAMQRHLDQGGQVLLFLNRRGYAPVLLCHDCGWVAKCQRCDAHMSLYQGGGRLRCHHCGKEQTANTQCPDCESTALQPVGAGTERLEEALKQRFPAIGVVRIDRDTTRRKGAMESLLDSVHDGSNRILVGTQMLAKGHHFPHVTLVGIVDVDQGLFSADFRATERMAQLIIQVAGRAGRAEKAGQVLIQTHHPDHPLLNMLLREGYTAFATAALEERRQALWPPFSHLALLRAEAVEQSLPMNFLAHARKLAEAYGIQEVQLLGPIPAPMERRAGRFRAQLLIQAENRAHLHQLLTPWVRQLEKDKLGRKVRWSLDVDPQEMY
jgi:primosomal protein N' (replication factor Y)